MSNLKTLLIILVIIFLVGITGGEVYYLFFYQQEARQTTLSPPLSPSAAIQISPPQTQSLNTSQRARLYATNSAITSYIIRTQYKGKIIEFDTKWEITGNLDNRRDAARIKIKGEGDLPNEIFIGKNELSRIKVVDITRGEEASIDIGDLEIGDTILVDLILDFAKDTNISTREGKITKI